MLQGTELMPAPGQLLPPLAGDGLLHDLRRAFAPPPQSLLQGSNAPHALQPPFTVKIITVKVEVINFQQDS